MTSYRIAEAADLLSVSDDTVRRWIDSGRLKADLAADHTGSQKGTPLLVKGVDLAAFAESLAHQPDRERTRAAAVSARNRLSGIVVRVKKDTVMAQVELVCGPYRLVSLMSCEAADELNLVPGARAIASVKSTNVVIEKH
jgi:molybdopterin-binding protein